MLQQLQEMNADDTAPAAVAPADAAAAAAAAAPANVPSMQHMKLGARTWPWARSRRSRRSRRCPVGRARSQTVEGRALPARDACGVADVAMVGTLSLGCTRTRSGRLVDGDFPLEARGGLGASLHGAKLHVGRSSRTAADLSETDQGKKALASGGARRAELDGVAMLD